jgi:hypothetical protein
VTPGYTANGENKLEPRGLTPLGIGTRLDGLILGAAERASRRLHTTLCSRVRWSVLLQHVALEYLQLVADLLMSFLVGVAAGRHDAGKRHSWVGRFF